MASPTVIETVFWEDDRTRTRDVVGRCQTCARMHPTLSLTPARLVSPTGLAHHGTEWGTTSCGHDASGPDWWWP